MLSRIGVVVTVLLAAAVFIPSQTLAAGSDQYIRCTVASDLHDQPYRESVNVVLGVATTQKQSLVDASAAYCARLISNTYWIGVDKFEQWDTYKRYQRLCDINLNSDMTVIVWSDDINGSMAFGSYICMNLGPSDSHRVAYVPVSTVKDYAARFDQYFSFTPDNWPLG
jgi:hypothetical protein